MEDRDIFVTGQQAADTQTALRQALGLPPEQFPLPAFIGMLSDEIEQLRQRGDSDEDIAGRIQAVAGVQIEARDIAAHYASPEQRGHHG